MTAGYVLTGETRPYDRTRGTYQDVVPQTDFRFGQGGGAWELTAGWGFIDLNDQNIAGGRMNTVALGLNWHLNSNTKFMFNVIHAFLDQPVHGDSEATVFAIRTQVQF